jgi:hypothetical protein
MLDAVMYNINPISIKFDDDPIPPVGFELSLSRDYDMIVWKKALGPEIKPSLMRYSWDYPSYRNEHVIVKLKIPKDAAVLFTPTKCRANRAIVLGFYPCELGGETHELAITSAMSLYDWSYKYNLGETIRPDYFDHDWHKTCSHGIHFFRTFEEAVNYVF